ncbi:MAG: hypothetical protein ACTSPB_02960 [Candidatus Thorarchaeota archaeon]
MVKVKNSNLTNVEVGVTIDLRDTSQSKYKEYFVKVTLVPNDSKLVYHHRTGVMLPDMELEKQITEVAKQEALKITAGIEV